MSGQIGTRSKWLICDDCGDEFWGRVAKLCVKCKNKKHKKVNKRFEENMRKLGEEWE